MPKHVDRQEFLDKIKEFYGDVKTVNRAQVINVSSALKIKLPAWLTNDPKLRVARGVYSLTGPVAGPAKRSRQDRIVPVQSPQPVVNIAPEPVSVQAPAMNPSTEAPPAISYIPKPLPGYVPFGNYGDIKSIVASRKFYPIFITGLSGNGKTITPEEVCAQTGRELIRVNITRETDEDDLIGGFELANGQTVWRDRAVVIAMERGAVLLLDEIDLGDSKLMCLQPVLEGKPIFLKPIIRVVYPAPGFTIIATANTKGKGSSDGRFIGTNVLNEAFLERFPITFEQDYPPIKIEEKILRNVFAMHDYENDAFVGNLVQWANITRKSFEQGAINDLISTRRLVHIAEAYMIFGYDKMKAITLCLNRFDNEMKKGFLELYQKVDAEIVPPAPEPSPPAENAEQTF